MLAFTLSLDDLVIASFTTGPGATTLPMRIYSQVRLGVTPEINAVCTILIAVVTIGVIIASIATKRREAQRIRDEQAALRGRPQPRRRPQQVDDGPDRQDDHRSQDDVGHGPLHAASKSASSFSGVSPTRASTPLPTGPWPTARRL